jgi:hypothetical protein
MRWIKEFVQSSGSHGRIEYLWLFDILLDLLTYSLLWCSSIDLPNIAAGIYNVELANRLRAFLVACPPSSPTPPVTQLMLATADFQRDLVSWGILDNRNAGHAGNVHCQKMPFLEPWTFI